MGMRGLDWGDAVRIRAWKAEQHTTTPPEPCAVRRGAGRRFILCCPVRAYMHRKTALPLLANTIRPLNVIGFLFSLAITLLIRSFVLDGYRIESSHCSQKRERCAIFRSHALLALIFSDGVSRRGADTHRYISPSFLWMEDYGEKGMTEDV